MITKFIAKITENQDLTTEEASAIIEYISKGNANDAQIAAFLASLKTKGESISEMTGFALKMRETAVPINTTGLQTIVDSCGTGGDNINSFNISTASAILAAACGACVAKHSNASITSKCGSSNVLDALGIKLLQEAGQVEKSLQKLSIGFIHAPFFHKSTLHVNRVRKELGIRTVFNFLGPLTNPARPAGQVIGVSKPEMLPKIVEVLRNLGCERGLVVSGIAPVMDEISICGKTKVFRLENSEIDEFEIKPEDFGFETAELSDIEGGTPDVNAGIIEDIFSGKIKGPKLEITLLNTGALLWTAKLADNIEQGINIALKSIENGSAANKLEQIRQFS